MDDILKLASQFGGAVVPEQAPAGDIAALASQFGGTIAQTPGGYGAGTFAADITKNVAAGAIPGVIGAPEALESAAVQQSKSMFAVPTEALSYLSSPDKLANKFVTSLGFKPIFGEETKGLVPEQVLKKQEMVLDEVSAKGKSKWLKDLSSYGNKLGQDIADTVSPEMKLAMANFVPTGSLSDIAHGRIDKLSFGANPTLLGFAGQFSNVFGSVAPGMLGTIITKDPRYMEVFGFGQGGSEAIGNARQYISSLNDEQLAKNSPYFKELINSGYDPKTARQIVEEKAADTAATAEGIVGTLGGSFTANLITGKFDKALLSSVKNRALRITAQAGKGAVTGATEEGIQEMSEGIASDLGIDKTVAKEIGPDAFANLVLGAIGGGGPGAVSGARAKPTQTTVPPSTTPPAEVNAPAETNVAPKNTNVAPAASGLVSPEELETPAVTPEVTPVSAKEKIAKLMEPKPNNPEVEAEGLKMVEELKRLGHVPFAEGMESNIKGGGFDKPGQLDFYRQKLEEAKALAQEEGKEFHEDHSMDKYLSSHKADQKRFNDYLPNAPEPVKNLVAKSNEYLQKLTDQINAKGYKLLDVDSRAPADVQALKAQISGIAGSTVAYVKNAEHIDKNNRFANPDKFENIGQTLDKDFANADQLLGKPSEKIAQEKDQLEENQGPVEKTTTPVENAKPEEIQVSEKPSETTPPVKQALVPLGKATSKGIAKYLTKIAEATTPEERLDAVNELRAAGYTEETAREKFPLVYEKVFGEPKTEEKVTPAEERPGAAYEKRASDDYNKVVDESYDGKKNDTDVLANQSLDRYIPFDKLVDIVSNAEDVLLAPEQLKMRFGVQKAADANRVIQAVRKARTKAGKAAKESHIEGNKVEPITSKTIEESIDKAMSSADTKKVKAAIKNQFDQAMKRAKIDTEEEWNSKKGLKEADKFVIIDVPGDGKFKVKNNKENIEKLQKKAIAATNLKVGTIKRGPSAASVSSPDVVLKNMIEDGELDNAFEYAKTKDLDPAEVYAAKFREILDKEGVEPAIAYAKENKIDLNTAGASMVQREALKKYFGTSEKYNEFRKSLGQKIATAKESVQPNIEPGKKQTAKERIAEIHEEQIKEYASQKRRLRSLSKKVAEGKVNITIQREIAALLESTSELKQDIRLSTPKYNSALDFLDQAVKARKRKAMSQDVFDVIRYFYNTRPELLEGIKLSVRQSKEDGVMGNFAPLTRLVTLYNGLGAESVTTARHEIMHSLEQMMNSEQRIAIIDAWKDALEMAIKQYGQDQRASMYFNAVIDFINSPNETNFKRAASIMPSKDFYQFINPSEYWAVNAEKLMAAKMGTPWAKFVKFVKGLGEALKALFGLENNHALHTTFNDLITGKKKRMDKESLTSYMNGGNINFDFLNDVKETDDLLEKHDRPDAPIHTSNTVTDQLLGGIQAAKKIVTKLKDNPKGAAINMVGNVDRAVLSARIDTTDFTAGLTAADAVKYGRELTNSEGIATASVAMNQALKATRIGTQVIMLGKLAFDEANQMFHAVQDKFSMANIVTLKHQLEGEIGKQRAANVIQAYFEAKRSKSIVQEALDREGELERLKTEQQTVTTSAERQVELVAEIESATEDFKNIQVALDKVNMDDEAIEDFIGLEKEYPQLKEMMQNWNHVNRNMIDMMEHSRIISAKRAETLRNIDDYVPWQRIQDEQADVHAPVFGSKGVRNINREHRFTQGKVDADINDIVDNMLHNVMVTTRNSIKNYAANRIAQEYAVRNEKGKIKVYPKEDFEHGIVKILVNGKKINVKIADPLIAKSVIGIEHIQIPMNEMLAFFSNGLRRSITFSGIFQVKQLFMDAPTAALVTGVKNPVKLFGGVFGSFVKGLTQNDPVIELLKSYGIGGYHSGARTAEHQYKQEIGLLNKSAFARAASVLDQISDASDFAQRRAVYNRVMAETNGDQRKAILAATNVIDFDKRGAGRTAQFLNRTISFMNAYAQQIDVLAQALAEPIASGVEMLTGQKISSISGNLKGITRSEAISRLAIAGGLLATTCLMYSMAVGDDDEYKKMDDQTKMRNFVIPKSLMKQIGYEHSLLIPMHTSASYFFKAIPELLYNKITKEGTKDAIDNTRLLKALKEGAVDALLGPLGSGPIPTAIKPGIEIAINHDFFTGGTVTPEGMKNLDPSRQYRGSTSELGKWFSAASGMGTGHRLLNPIEADHIMRGLGGSVSAIAMWGSNLFSGNRASPTERDNILYGSFIAPDVGRGREDLFYDLQQRSNTAMGTFKDLMKKGHEADAQVWFKNHEGAIQAYGFTEAAGKGLQEINAQIRRLEDMPANKLSPADKRQQIDFYKKRKEEILEQTIKFRLSAGL